MLNVHFVKDTELVEGVRQRADNFKTLHYDDRLKHLGLTRLDRRRYGVV